MAPRMMFILCVAGLAAAGTSLFGGDDLETAARANPQVMRTFPADGQIIAPGPFVLLVSYDLPMRADSYSFVRSDKGDFPNCAKKPMLRRDGRTFELACTAEPGKRYHVRFNYGRNMNFVSAEQSVAAISYAIGFSTRP